MLKRGTLDKTRFNTKHEQQWYTWLETHSYFLKVLSISHMLQKCTERTRGTTNKVTIRLSVDCMDIPILQHGRGIRIGRKHTQPTQRHEAPRISEIRSSSAGVPSLCLCEVGAWVSQLQAFSRACGIPPGRWPLLLEAAARDFWHGRVEVPLSLFFPISPSSSFYIILLAQLGFFPSSCIETTQNRFFYWSWWFIISPFMLYFLTEILLPMHFFLVMPRAHPSSLLSVLVRVQPQSRGVTCLWSETHPDIWWTLLLICSYLHHISHDTRSSCLAFELVSHNCAWHTSLVYGWQTQKWHSVWQTLLC